VWDRGDKYGFISRAGQPQAEIGVFGQVVGVPVASFFKDVAAREQGRVAKAPDQPHARITLQKTRSELAYSMVKQRAGQFAALL
tara:strand:- start:210 stop:461 length:252 start_codon:yes stop_codon:yes gene_type:complete